MRAVVDRRLAVGPDVRSHLELCLDCRACESACPSGVQYGQMIEPFKVALQATAPADESMGLLDRLILHHLFPYAGRVKAALAAGASVPEDSACSTWPSRSGLTRLLPGTLRRLQAMLPKLAGPALAHRFPRSCRRSARGGRGWPCSWAASPTPSSPRPPPPPPGSFSSNGCEVVIPRGQGCCGAIHYHSGVEAPALDLARQNLAAFDPQAFDAIIVNAAGCGAMLKDYGHLLPDDRARRRRGSRRRSTLSPSSSSHSAWSPPPIRFLSDRRLSRSLAISVTHSRSASSPADCSRRSPDSSWSRSTRARSAAAPPGRTT